MFGVVRLGFLMQRRKQLSLLCLLGIVFSSTADSCAIGQVANSTSTTNGVVVSSGQQVIDAHHLNGASGLSVAKGATAIIDFGTASSINLTGNLSNYGSIYAVSTNPQVHTANLSALNISNMQGGLLTTVLPSGGFSVLPNLLPNLNLSIAAVNSIYNAGVISSAANLNLSAGNTITNIGTMSAVQNVNILAGINGLVNSGLIQSIAANINVSTLAAQNLVVNNTNGTMQALLGSINMSTLSSVNDKPDLTIFGGNLLSKELNITDLLGATDINVNNVSGTLNVSACSAHVTAAGPNLSLGAMNITGDPTFYNTTGSITINSDLIFTGASFSLANLAIVANTDILTGSGATQINTSNTLGNGGNILMVAGAQFTSSGPATVPSGGTISSSGSGDTSSTLTITGASSTGGKIDLTGGGNFQTINTTGSTSGQAPPGNLNGASGGFLTMVAYSGSGFNAGTINMPSTMVINTSGSPAGYGSVQNGNVTLIAGAATGQAITTGTIITSGNIGNTNVNNGVVYIGSATPTMLQFPGALSPGPVINQAIFPGTSIFQVINPAGLVAGQTVVINPFGANSETATINNVTGGQITLNSPLQNSHSSTENIYVSAASLVIPPGAVVSGCCPGGANSVINNGGVFAPGALQGGNITLGPISSGANIVVASNPLSSNTVTFSGNVNLAANPQQQTTLTGGTVTNTPAAYLTNPSISINAGQVIVNNAVVVSSEIPSCSTCFNSLNINAQSINNSGSLVGYNVNLKSPAGQNLTITNTGQIVGGAVNAGATQNAFVDIQSGGSLILSGTGSISAPGTLSVIEVAAADGKLLNINSSHTFSTGAEGLVILDAQRNTGEINIAGNSTETFSPGSYLVVNTPSLTLDSGSSITGASFVAFTSGLAYQADGVTPVPLTITVIGGTAHISSSGSPSYISMRPIEGANIIFTGASSTLNFSQTANLVVSNGGTVQTNNITVSPFQQVSGLPGAGIAFQPYVGPLINTNGYTNFAAYSYQQVLSLMAPLAASQLFPILSTYTQGVVLDTNNQPLQSYSTGYVIQAAKEIGLRVSAGVFINMNNAGTVTSQTDSKGNPVDLSAALSGAAKYGNVVDVVMGNEDIVGGQTPAPSITTLTNLISAAQTLRNSTTNPLTGTNFSSTSLPVTTRQVGGVFDIVNPSFGNAAATTAMVALMKQVDGYVYGNFYPFFNNNVIQALTCQTCTPAPNYPYIGMAASQPAFTSLVQYNMSQQYTPVATDVKTYVGAGAPSIRIGETGWGTSGPPQASLTYAGYYFPAMQSWSSTTIDPVKGTPGVPIVAYFEAYNEPWKPTDKGLPGGPGTSTVTLLAAASAGSTSITVSGPTSNFTGLSQIVIDPPAPAPNAPPPFNPPPANQEFANIMSVTTNGSGQTVLNLYSPLTQNHSSHEIVDAGEGAEKSFGIWVANGTNFNVPPLQPQVSYALNSITQNFALPSQPLLVSSLSLAPQPVAPQVIPSPQIIGALPALNLSALNAAISSSSGTIIQTDINPAQDKPGAANPNAINADLATSQGLVAVGLGPAGIPLNPKDSLVIFNGNNLLLSPDHNLSVQTNLAQIQIDAGSAVMMVQNGETLGIYALHDDHSGAVTVTLNGQNIEIPIGRQLVLTSNGTANFDEVSPIKMGYRGLTLSKLGNLKAFMSEFSLPTALSTTDPLRKLMKSHDKEDQQLAGRLLKTAAAMMIMGRLNQPFQPIKKTGAN